MTFCECLKFHLKMIDKRYARYFCTCLYELVSDILIFYNTSCSIISCRRPTKGDWIKAFRKSRHAEAFRSGIQLFLSTGQGQLMAFIGWLWFQVSRSETPLLPPLPTDCLLLLILELCTDRGRILFFHTILSHRILPHKNESRTRMYLIPYLFKLLLKAVMSLSLYDTKAGIKLN